MISSLFVDVIVIGAGLSGLQAAVDLDKAGLSYIVHEANDRDGGKALSVPASPKRDGLVDLGAARINDSNQKEMYALAQDFGFDLVVQRSEGLSPDQSNGSTHAIPFEQFKDFTNEQLAEILAIMAKLDEFGDGIAEVLMMMLARDLLAVEADKLSALLLINYIKSGTGLANISSDRKDGGHIICFHVGQPGRKWSQLCDQEHRDTAVKQFNDAFGAVVPEPIDIIEKDWLKDPWFPGGPSLVMKPGLLTGAGKSIRDLFKNIYFIGTETFIVWKGYMEGAIRSGIRGACEIIEALDGLAYL
ncbi:flavin-containing protein [Fusarium sp. NRRL 52700]|nr:flavin-containing protein [Fusarium sp. NRRL 52700]